MGSWAVFSVRPRANRLDVCGSSITAFSGGAVSRRIERSPLPFGRHDGYRPAIVPDLEIVADRLGRVKNSTWLNEQAAIPWSPEHGPGWHLAVLPVTGCVRGVRVVVSHDLADGSGGVLGGGGKACGYRQRDQLAPCAGHAAMAGRLPGGDARKQRATIPDSGRAIVRAHDGPSVTPRKCSILPHRVRCPPQPTERITLPMATSCRCRRVGRPRRRARGNQQNALLRDWRHDLAQRVGVSPQRLGHIGDGRQRRTANDNSAKRRHRIVDVTVGPIQAKAKKEPARDARTQSSKR